MSRPLVIVESPAKAKTIARHLGSGYDVRASVGHIADLPTKGLGIDVENGFKPMWELTTRGKDVVKELQARLPIGDTWRYEPKLDGFRGLLWHRTGGTVQLLSRNGRDLAPWFPELHASGRRHAQRRAFLWTVT